MHKILWTLLALLFLATPLPAGASTIFTFTSTQSSPTAYSAAVETATDTNDFAIIGPTSLPPCAPFPGGVGACLGLLGNWADLVGASGYTPGFRTIVFNSSAGVVNTLMVQGQFEDYSFSCNASGDCTGTLISDFRAACTANAPCTVLATVSVREVPEPAAIALLAAGLLGLSVTLRSTQRRTPLAFVA